MRVCVCIVRPLSQTQTHTPKSFPKASTHAHFLSKSSGNPDGTMRNTAASSWAGASPISPMISTRRGDLEASTTVALSRMAARCGSRVVDVVDVDDMVVTRRLLLWGAGGG